MSGEQLPAVKTWFNLIDIILLICTMATSQHNAAPEVKPAVKACRDLATVAQRPTTKSRFGRGGRLVLHHYM